MQKLTIEEMRELAVSRKGKCLSEKYINSSTKLKWQCKEGHVWEAIPRSVKNGTWCPICGGSFPLDLKEMQCLAETKKGKCLSTEYINSRSKLRWQCKEGHIWEATPGKIKTGSWCPICSTNVSERICRDYFERIFSKKFQKSHPKWLINSRGNQMELDVYNDELRIAFEYQGKQHYKPVGVFNKSRSLETIREDDKKKEILCKEHNIILFKIPYSVKPADMGRYIVAKTKTLNLKVPYNRETIDYQSFDVASPERLLVFKEIARKREGICLSEKYINDRSYLNWQCKEGHRWKAMPNSIKQGTWCPICGGHLLKTIEQIRELAKSKGGLCLSTKYINSQTKLKWQCKLGHVWEATPNHVKLGTWCPICKRILISQKVKKYTIKDMKKLAEKKRGKCLSKEFVPVLTKIRWQCNEGHVWEATPSHIQNGTWCPVCSKNYPLTLSDMHNLVKSKGGKCLSTEYVNNQTKLRWQCKEGHVWEAIPSSIKRGSWCPQCARENRKRK